MLFLGYGLRNMIGRHHSPVSLSAFYELSRWRPSDKGGRRVLEKRDESEAQSSDDGDTLWRQ